MGTATLNSKPRSPQLSMTTTRNLIRLWPFRRMPGAVLPARSAV